MGETDDRPAYLTANNAKYSLGIHRGPLISKNADEGAGLAQVESAGGMSLETKKLKAKEKFQRHWKRFWCLHLFVTIIFLAIFLPVFFLVAIPAISQMVVNKSDLVLVSAAVLNPRPDMISLTLESAINLKLALPVRIDPINVDLFVRDAGASNAWANTTIDGKVIKGNSTLAVKDVETPISNQTTWVEYVHNVVNKKDTALSIKGTTMSYLGVLKSKVTMDKDVVSPVLDQFKGFTVSDMGLVAKGDDGSNLQGNATLPNHSLLTLDLGTIVLDVKSGNLTIGNATLKDVTIYPGNNTFPLTGVLDISKVIHNLGAVLASQASALKTGNLALDTITTSITWNGTLVPYYTKVMSGLTLTANLGVADLLKNSIHNLLSGNSSITDALHSVGGLSGLVGNLTDSQGASDTASAALAESSKLDDLKSKLKSNVAVRDMFKDHSVQKRDGIVDALAGMYMKL
ncbi:unnamed protein product [Penicillium salamii]|uniref:Uncharacterized protein n=1 Tax=Penicillium salamii TaxID=1612424 RepID=A0A9W4J409_9EURO|nr:unnamed protein product [Penicillium salamii]CAG8187454.1 unnamed protein product [Penicillium salamii]CAG8264118.1 unnamed protein product [Penicillium salamii]CAG8312267.1 unnamed protein product [Penicillium salamii]CAG8371011.1 unnamed protein product [Penicillium salamii]